MKRVLFSAVLALSASSAFAQIVSIPSAASVQAVTLMSASQVVADSKGGAAAATAPALVQTAEISASGLPSATVSAASAPTVTVSGGGSASATISQTAQSLTVIPVISTGVSALASVPAISVIVP